MSSSGKFINDIYRVTTFGKHKQTFIGLKHHNNQYRGSREGQGRYAPPNLGAKFKF